jgi:alpha-N-acetylglucosamine transferase
MDMVLLITGEAKDQMSASTWASLVDEGWIMCPVEAIEGPPFAHYDSNRFLLGLLYTKLMMWRLTEYTAVMSLDLDMLVMRDPTDIFTSVLPKMLSENKTFGAVVDRPGPGAMKSPKCGMQWTDTPIFNGGSLLIVPSNHVFTILIDNLRVIPHDVGLAEQSYLNAFYNKSTFYSLPFTYNGNMRSILCEPHIWGDGDVQILHFNVEKPWGFARMDLFDEHRLVPYMLLWQSVLDNNF